MHRFAGECNNDNNEPTVAALCGLFLLRRSYMLRNTSHCHPDLIEISSFVLTFQHPQAEALIEQFRSVSVLSKLPNNRLVGQLTVGCDLLIW
jgi:hypothetical protein